MAELILEGNILGIKGIGGTHLACSSLLDDVILRLRSKKGKRKNKPFALMSKDLVNIRNFAKINQIEEELLLSFRKPIILLNKKEPFPLSKWISPNLHNIGVMLPYSGIHSLLLEKIDDPAIILTSANPSDIPMFIDNFEIKTKLADLADFIVIHDRRIHQRADDSVIRITNSNPVIIRRSRGWVPEPINLPFNIGNEVTLGVGPLLTSTATISIKDRSFPTQYIGDVDTLETLDFLNSSINHLESLLGIKKYTAIGHDLHPTFLSTELAKNYSDKHEAKMVGVQHHYAHAISLMVDNKVNIEDEIVAIVADGVGYGHDGKVWGGEILHTGYRFYKRIGHLEEQPMIGGDRATYFPIRMFAGIISKKISIDELSTILKEKYPHSLPDFKNEISVLLTQLKNNLNISYTTSTGRILAAISSMLHACYERTYEGEPAIVLESLAYNGKANRIKFNIDSPNKNIINTTDLVEQAYNKLISGAKPADIALAVQLELAKQFAMVAIEYAQENSIKKIGFTGGVAYNEFITRKISNYVKKTGLDFLEHKSLPCGDGSISIGQSIKASVDNQ